MEPPPPTVTDAHSDAEADAFVIDALDRAQRAFEATVNPDTPKDEQRLAVFSYIHHVSIVVLYECFAHVLPDRARRAAQWLEDALEDDTAAQWVHEARQALATGKRIPFPFDETDRSGVSR